ncbi:cellulose synthase subunit BcsC-related outer membrane protein, partial [Pseudomonas sp. MPR-E5]|uniref:cellulose synthase subunit BcsC-related outer membrane protein n=1 Tax=Pseudomonas sp. MPR-E5 TaxID=2070595 RepID=UPI0013049B18
LRASVLDGRHVRDNRFVGARFAADHTVWRAGAVSASVGVTLTYWDYREQLLGYTWGQGGYWSPQGYGSLALPLELLGQAGGSAF